MALDYELARMFAKMTNDQGSRVSEATVQGTVKEYAGGMYVQLDGSDLLTPVSSTTGMKDGDRVNVMIKDHSATVTGNTTAPSATKDDTDIIQGQLDDTIDQISEFEIVLAGKVDTEVLNAQIARIDNLTADNVVIKESLSATEANIKDLQAENVTISGQLDAFEADIDNLHANMLTAEAADLKYATIENLEATDAKIYNLEGTYAEFEQTVTEKLTATDASIENLEATKLSAEEADLKYANIDFANIGKAAIENFFSKSGMIGDLVVGEGTITGTLVGVTIKGDLIEGGTVVADKLVIKGEDGLYYKLNTDGETVESSQTDYNSLNGSVITAKSITATKISVDDLVAFDATIGGFKITESSIYSGVKESIDNTTRGIFMDDTGQMALGDQSNYLKYFKDTDGVWKLIISAGSIKLGGSSKDIETAFDEINQKIENKIDNLDVGATNLALYTDRPKTYIQSGANNWFTNKDTTDTYGYGPRTSDLGLSLLKKGGEFTVSFDWAAVNVPKAFEFYVALEYQNGSYKTFGSTYTMPKQAAVSGHFVTTAVPSADQMEWGRGFLFGGIGSGTNYPDFEITISNFKFEKGNKETTWSQAPEELISGEYVDDIEESLSSDIAGLEETISEAFINIDSINAKMEFLVTDENGNSMMTQTSDGWTFNMSSIQNTVDKAFEDIDTIHGDISSANKIINDTKNLVDDISQKTAYINLGQDESGSPCILLGDTASPFKLRITNTSIDFMEGSDKIAYVTNRQLYIQSSVVTDEMRVGSLDQNTGKFEGFVWKKRANGNMGLRWEG